MTTDTTMPVGWRQVQEAGQALPAVWLFLVRKRLSNAMSKNGIKAACQERDPTAKDCQRNCSNDDPGERGSIADDERQEYAPSK
jgi:hypothetical protein